ncbi:TetR/AcrR family transcriptional regulator [Amycolatopsis sp. NPDC059027]|uniref:TetR/AcrR family transcriptional regulator n=1 Tax=unclassified Amycolatopsis TaxID=2618356 RepID=UPI00366BE885
MTDVSTEYSGSGDPRRTIELLWGVDGPPRRGPKPKLSVTDVVRAAIKLADTDGIAGVSMRRVADELGVSPMSLYTYVPSRAELVDLMLDHVHAELAAVEPGTGWRAALTAIAEDSWRMYHRHPWMLQVVTGRPTLGPHTFAKYERELAALDGIGLDDLEMDALTTLLNGVVQGFARGSVEAARLVSHSGMTDQQWWDASAPVLAEIPAADPANYPLASRVGTTAGQAHGAAASPGHAFHFSLARILDSIETLIASRTAR